jgi:hypothetical protein
MIGLVKPSTGSQFQISALSANFGTELEVVDAPQPGDLVYALPRQETSEVLVAYANDRPGLWGSVDSTCAPLGKNKNRALFCKLAPRSASAASSVRCDNLE